MRRGFIFTLDALLSIVFIMLFITSITAIVTNNAQVYVTQTQAQNRAFAQSTLETLRTVPLSNLVSSTKIDEWISSGVLNLTYVSPQMSPLQIGATYWSLAPKYPRFKTYAEEILGYVLGNTLKGYSYQLIINNYTSPYLTFNNSFAKASQVGSATMIVSGYIANSTPRGYVAKAYITKMIKEDAKIYTFDTVLAYPYVLKVDHLYLLGIYFPVLEQDSANISDNFYPRGNKTYAGLFYMPSRNFEYRRNYFGIEFQLIPATVTLKLNGEVLDCNGIRYEDYQLDTSKKYIKISDDSLQNNCNLLDNLVENKTNSLKETVKSYKMEINFFGFPLSFDVPWIAIGDSGSSHLVYKYKTSAFVTSEFKNRFDFPTVSTDDPTQIEKAIFVPSDIHNLSVVARIDVPQTTTNVTLRIRVGSLVVNVSSKQASGIRVLTWTGNEILNALKKNGMTFKNLTNRYFYVVLDIGLPEYETIASPYEEWIKALESGNTKEVSYELKKRFQKINGGFKLIGEESYVYVNHTKPEIPRNGVTLTLPWNTSLSSGCNGEWCTDVTWTVNIPPAMKPLYTTFQFPYYRNILENENPSQQIYLNNNLLYCHGPVCNPNRPLLAVFNHWGFGEYTNLNNGEIIKALQKGKNTFGVEFGNGFYVSKDNSVGSTVVLMKTFVPYGKVFSYYTQDNACAYNLTYYYRLGNSIKNGTVRVGFCPVNGKSINIAASQLKPTEYALDNAIFRLFVQLGAKNETTYLPGTVQNPILVDLQGLQVGAIGVRNVPTTMAPITVTLRVWRGRR